jgi:hypothetical protein
VLPILLIRPYHGHTFLPTNDFFEPAGRYAGSKKSLVGKMYARDMAGLKEWEALGGSVINGLDEPELFLVDIFRRGTTRLIVFTVQEDTAVQEYKIIDVVEIKNVLTTQEIKTGVCRLGKKENSFIVALVKPRNIQYNKAIKAWRLNRDKRRVEIVSAATVDCLQEAFDE